MFQARTMPPPRELIAKPGIVPAQNHGAGCSDCTRLNLREPSTRSMAAQTLMIALPLVTAWPDLIVGGLPKTTAHCQPPRPSSSRVYWTSRYSIDRPVAFRRRSGPQILVALRSCAKAAVMLTWAGASAGMKPACPTQGYGVMGSKSREVIYGGIGARIRAEGAQEAAQKAVREADRAAAELWSIQMEAYGGPAQPSPTIRAMPQRRLWLATGQMPSLRNRGQHPARTRPQAARHADLEIGGGIEMPVMPDTALFATRAYDQADDAARDRGLQVGASG